MFYPMCGLFKIAVVNPIRSCVNATKVINITYIVFASCLVCYGLYKSIERMKEGKVLVREEVRVLPKMKYPSVTFCYKYKHGRKEAMQTYRSHFIEKWKKSG